MKKIIIAALLLVGFSWNISYADTQTPEEYVTATFEEIKTLINADVTELKRLHDFLPFMKRNVDIEFLVESLFFSRTRKMKWAESSAEEKAEAFKLMTTYMSMLYLQNFEAVSGDSVIQILDVETTNDLVIVKTKVEFSDILFSADDIEVKFQLGKLGDSFIIQDIQVSLGDDDYTSVVGVMRSSYRRQTAKGVSHFITKLSMQLDEILKEFNESPYA